MVIKVEPTILMMLTGEVKNHGFTIEPIRITEEILLKCGFVKALGVFNIECCKSILYLRLAYDKGFYYGIKSSDCNSCEFDDVISIKYLHQLQNLYFALTGQELEIKL